MSGKKKSRKAKRQARKDERASDFAMAEENWQNYSQWKHEATTSHDKNVRGINQKYGAENQTLRDILVGEEDRKFESSMKSLDEGATGQQLQAFRGQYNAKQWQGMDDEEYFNTRLGEFNPEDTAVAGEEAAGAGASGRAPTQPGADDEGKEYYGW